MRDGRPRPKNADGTDININSEGGLERFVMSFGPSTEQDLERERADDAPVQRSTPNTTPSPSAAPDTGTAPVTQTPAPAPLTSTVTGTAASSAPAPATVPAPVPAPVTEPDEDANKTPEQLRAEAKQLRAENRRNADRARELERQAEIDAAVARRMPAPQAPVPAPAPAAAPAPDPRIAQLQSEIKRLWFDDPDRVLELQQQLTDIRMEQRERELRSTLRSDAEGVVQARDRQQQAQYAQRTAGEYISSRVPTDQITENRISAVYQILTRPSAPGKPNPYYDAGGILNPNAIIAVWKELYGLPDQPGASAGTGAAPATASAPAPVAVAAAAPAPAPPGSSRPATAAISSSTSTDALPRLSTDQVRAYEKVAEDQGVDPEKLKERARRRMQREGNRNTGTFNTEEH
jgi:hypothetical protein